MYCRNFEELPLAFWKGRPSSIPNNYVVMGGVNLVRSNQIIEIEHSHS